MTRPQKRHLLVVLACLVVALAALGAPVAAAATTDTTEVAVTLDSGGDDTKSDDDTSDDTESTDDGTSEDTSTNTDDSDEDSDSTEDDDVEKTVSDTTDDSDDNSSSADDSEETVQETSETVVGTANSLDLVIYPGDTRLSQPGVGAPGIVDPVDGSLDDPVGQTPAEIEGPGPVSRSDDASSDGEDASNSIPLSSSGGQPLPSGSSGGAAIGLGVLAAAAAFRATPALGSIGVPVFGSVGSAALPSLLDRIRPFLFPLRYSRYDNSDPLEHEAREQVYEIVNDRPGSYLSEVSERAGLPLSTTRHHIKVLEREDLVSGAKLRGKRRFYPAYAEGIELAAALNDDSTASIIDAIARLGAASVSDLADELGRDPSTISHHLQRLDEDDIIARERDGRSVLNKLSAEARTALEPDATPKPGEASEALAGGAD